ncbi:MAG: hypothetical protein KAH48_06160 [Chlorobi bacterium]|nr:hypothetical protein [Chlorobiota bacterium]
MKIITILSLVLISFIIAACSESSVDPASSVDNPNGSYRPLAIGNYWILVGETQQGSNIVRDTVRYEILSTVEIDGETWFETGVNGSVSGPPMRWKNDTLFMYDSKSVPILNENIKGGDTLNYYVYEDDDFSTIDITMVEGTDMELTVNGISYKNVALIKTTSTKIINGTTRVEEFIGYWAKGVGIIKSVNPYGTGSLLDYHIED